MEYPHPPSNARPSEYTRELPNRERGLMIARIWHGWTTTENANAYQHLLTTSIVPDIISKAIPGLDGVDILRRADGPDTDVKVVTLMTFDDWSAVAAFAGPDRTGSVVPVAARQLLKRYDEHSQHYEIVARFTAS